MREKVNDAIKCVQECFLFIAQFYDSISTISPNIHGYTFIYLFGMIWLMQKDCSLYLPPYSCIVFSNYWADAAADVAAAAVTKDILNCIKTSKYVEMKTILCN